jgi:hypothetical protein
MGENAGMTEADEAARALADMLGTLSTSCPGGWYERHAGAAAAISAVAAAPLNRIIGETSNPDIDAVAMLAARVEGDGHRFMVESRPGARGLEHWCRGRGLTDFARAPLMTCPTSRLSSPTVEGITWLSLGVQDMPAHVEVAEAGYEMPPNGLGGLERSTLFGEGEGAGLIAEVDGAPACTGVNHALLQSSAMGKGVYESLGFVTVEDWTRWAPIQEAAPRSGPRR